MSTNNGWNNQILAANSAITLNSGTNAVNVSTDAFAATVDVSTGAGNKSLTLGSTNTTSTTNIQSGSGGINIPQFIEGALITDSSGEVTSVTGTAGYVLTADVAGTPPSFQPASGGGAGSRVLIQSQDATNDATIDFTSGITGYTYYELEFLGVVPVTDNTDLQLQISTDGGMTWIAGTNYRYFTTNTDSGANTFSAVVAGAGGTSQYVFAPGTSNDATYGINGIAQIFSMTSNPQITSSLSSTESTTLDAMQCLSAGRCFSSGSAVDALRLLFSSGNISVGTFRLFGII